METALRVALILALAGFTLWVAKHLHDAPVEGELTRLRSEVQRLVDANRVLDRENEGYRSLVRGLREDPRVLDRKARERLGMARPDELIILYDEPYDRALRTAERR